MTDTGYVERDPATPLNLTFALRWHTAPPRGVFIDPATGEVATPARCGACPPRNLHADAFLAAVIAANAAGLLPP